MGSHVTWMLFALHTPYSKFCNADLMMDNWPKHVIKIKYNNKYIYCCIWHSEGRASWYILITKPMRCTSFKNLFLEWNSTCFRQSLCPSSGVQHCTHSNTYRLCWQLASRIRTFRADPASKLSPNLYDKYLLLCVQCWTPDDGQRDCLKHVEFHSKDKFVKLEHLIGFVIRIYIVVFDWNLKLSVFF